MVRLMTHFKRQEEHHASVSETSRVLGTSGVCRQTHELMALTARVILNRWVGWIVSRPSSECLHAEATPISILPFSASCQSDQPTPPSQCRPTPTVLCMPCRPCRQIRRRFSLPLLLPLS